jgi:hypothetical protein
MDEADIDIKWAEFLDVQGNAIQQEVYESLQDSAHVFDVADGTHAKWANDGILGLLLVFSEEEADILLAAFHAGVEGIEDATYAWGVWVTSLMGMIRQCMQGAAENN